MKRIAGLAVLALVGCSKSETMIGLRCPITMHYDTLGQKSERSTVQHLIVNLKDKSVTMYDKPGKLYNACGNQPCSVSITDDQIRVMVDRKLDAGDGGGGFKNTLTVDRYSSQIGYVGDMWTNADEHARVMYSGRCTKEAPILPEEHKF